MVLVLELLFVLVRDPLRSANATMETNAFSSLAVLNLQSSYSLFESACCPDKDLVVLVSRLGRKDRLSLWKIQGPKIWEVQVGVNIQEIVGVAWSPDGTRVALTQLLPSFLLTHSTRSDNCGCAKSPRIDAAFNAGWSRGTSAPS